LPGLQESHEVKIAVVLGTRPEIIKMFPVIKALKENKMDHFIVHSGQHYTYEMDKIFLEELSIRNIKHALDVGSGTHGKQTSRIVERCEDVFLKEKPDVVLVEGDTNTVFGAALAAVKLSIKVGHVEAGLRSYDRRMPEEINRVLTDHISDYCFAPTRIARENLIKEGIEKHKIRITGNTIVDAVLHFIHIAERKSDILERLSLSRGSYILVTAHRQETVDDRARLQDIIHSLRNLGKELGLKIVFPIHPRTETRIKQFGIKEPKEIRFTKPVGYLNFLRLERNARLVLTDSGGVQEEACILGVPCVTLRENTERPETVKAGANILAGTDPEKIVACAKTMVEKRARWKNPFGDGKAGLRIAEAFKRKKRP
jgi:UDP-N-acetylglucosamine 2-epimerase (non-hydrolysing)